VLLGFGLLLTATGRPIFAGVVLLSLGVGFAFVDRTKRVALREPVIFSDMSELPHVFTHPQLYLPFAGPGLVIGGAFAMIAVASERLAGLAGSCARTGTVKTIGRNASMFEISLPRAFIA